MTFLILSLSMLTASSTPAFGFNLDEALRNHTAQDDRARKALAGLIDGNCLDQSGLGSEIKEHQEMRGASAGILHKRAGKLVQSLAQPMNVGERANCVGSFTSLRGEIDRRISDIDSALDGISQASKAQAIVAQRLREVSEYPVSNVDCLAPTFNGMKEALAGSLEAWALIAEIKEGLANKKKDLKQWRAELASVEESCGSEPGALGEVRGTKGTGSGVSTKRHVRPESTITGVEEDIKKREQGN